MTLPVLLVDGLSTLGSRRFIGAGLPLLVLFGESLGAPPVLEGDRPYGAWRGLRRRQDAGFAGDATLAAYHACQTQKLSVRRVRRSAGAHGGDSMKNVKVSQEVESMTRRS